MKLKKTVIFDLDFQSGWVQWSAALMGLFFFLRVVYCLGFHGIADFDSGALWVELIFPLILGVGYIVLLRGFHLNMPVIYGIFGVLLCILMVVWKFQVGITWMDVLGLIWYAAAAVVLMATVMGYLGNRLILLAAFAVPVLFRFVFRDLGVYFLSFRMVDFLPELSSLCGLASISCLAPGLMGRKTE